MSAHDQLYQTVLQRLVRTIPPSAHVPQASLIRLCLLVTGLLAARSAVLAQAASALHALCLTRASLVDSITRRLRRALDDPRLTAPTCYAPVLQHVLDWDHLLHGCCRIELIVDESTKPTSSISFASRCPTGVAHSHWRGLSGSRIRRCRPAPTGRPSTTCLPRLPPCSHLA